MAAPAQQGMRLKAEASESGGRKAEASEAYHGRAERRKEERNINHAKSTGADACSILTFVEDGGCSTNCSIDRDRYPESTLI